MYDNLLLLKDIVDNAPLPIAIYLGDELEVELANPSMIKTWGKGDHVIGKKYAELLPEIQHQQMVEMALTVLKTGVAFHAKDKKVDLVIDGMMKTLYFNYSFIPLFNKEGFIYGVMHTGTDITDLHTSKDQTESSNERLIMAIDSSGIGAYEIDIVTQKIQTSGYFNTILSLDQEITAEELIDKLHPDDLVVLKTAYVEAQKTGKICYDARILNNDKSVKWIRINGKLINDENGNPKTIVGIIQDINEQRVFEDELKKQVAKNTDELRRSNDDLLHFASVVSHDLREPVRKIKFFNNILRNEKESDFNETSKKYLAKIEQSTTRMNNIIEGILAYSTMDKSQQPVEKVDLNEIIENIKTDLELIIKDKGAILITSKFPEIEGASILISQLFYNLIQNALKFSKADQPPRVIITSSLLNIEGIESIQITVKDNGIGLDAAFVERIFTAFERLHSKNEYEGNGLGLSLCRKIAKRHKGTITAAGKKDIGAEFTVTLPLKQVQKTI